jgi:hypothetical protein
VDSSVEH